MSATQIPSAEFQFGAAGRTEQVRALIADGRLRRLPFVANAASTPLAGTPAKPSIFPGPTPESPPVSPIEAEALRTADRDVSKSTK
jgi:hypothetical protein